MHSIRSHIYDSVETTTAFDRMLYTSSKVITTECPLPPYPYSFKEAASVAASLCSEIVTSHPITFKGLSCVFFSHQSIWDEFHLCHVAAYRLSSFETKCQRVCWKFYLVREIVPTTATVQFILQILRGRGQLNCSQHIIFQEYYHHEASHPQTVIACPTSFLPSSVRLNSDEPTRLSKLQLSKAARRRVAHISRSSRYSLLHWGTRSDASCLSVSMAFFDKNVD